MLKEIAPLRIDPIFRGLHHQSAAQEVTKIVSTCKKTEKYGSVSIHLKIKYPDELCFCDSMQMDKTA